MDHPPPPHLDRARVLRYAVSQCGGFHHIGSEAVAAIAICRYDGSGDVYLFKCTSDWEVIQDTDCASVDEALQIASRQVRSEMPEWIIVSSD